MARVEDSPWAIPVAQIASRAGQSKSIDVDFPASSGIDDSIVGIKEGEPVHMSGQFDSIMDDLVFTGRLVMPFVSECTRCLKLIDEDWPVDVTVFLPYKSGQDKANGKNDKSEKDDEIDIIAGEDESEDTYPLLENGAFTDIEAMIRDTLVELLPLQPLYRPGCRGLCLQCGADLSEDPDHYHDVTDIRFAGLAGLKAQPKAEQNGEQTE